MNHLRDTFARLGRRGTQAGLAALVAALLVTGAAWHGLAADPQSAARQHPALSSQPSPIGHSIAGARDSYADVVKVVAPAVVTIRTEGKARVSPTQFEGDDFFRRFFGDE